MQQYAEQLQQHYDERAIKPLMRDRGILRENEDIIDVFTRVTDGIMAADQEIEGQVDQVFATQLLELTADGSIAYGTPILTNTGRGGITLAACTVLPLQIDRESGQVEFAKFKKISAATLGDATGTGYDLSDLAEPVSQLKVMNEIIHQINVRLKEQHKRPVACMATLRADHPRIVEFINSKREENFQDWRFNISVFVTEELFQRAERGEMWQLKDSRGLVVDELPAQQLLDQIAAAAHYCGEPGILFYDRFHQGNPTPQWEYVSTAPCAEVAMAPGEVCQFSYVNLAGMYREELGSDGKVHRVVDFDKLRQTVAVLTRVLDDCVEVTMQHSTLDTSLVGAKRRIGVGATGFTDLLLYLGISYNSPAAVALAQQIAEVIDFASKQASVELAKRRGQFPAFPTSRYTDPDWVRRKHQFLTGIIPESTWETLYQEIAISGIRNASTTAYPPTGTSSQIAGTATSFEPYFELVKRSQGYPASPEKAIPVIAPHVLKALRERSQSPEELVRLIQALYDPESSHVLTDQHLGGLFATARQVPLQQHLEVQAAFQRFSDESTSKTVNLPQEATPADVMQAMLLAYTLGLKGMTVFRDDCLTERSIESLDSRVTTSPIQHTFDYPIDSTLA